MAVLWGAEAAPWLELVHQARGTELLFILWRARARPWHWTQTWQAVRGHIPKYVHARACYESLPPISPHRGQHEMFRQPVSLAPAASGKSLAGEGECAA